MRTTILQLGFLILALVFSGMISEANGQEQDRRFSLSINGGISFASASAGGRVDGGFDIATKTNLAFGLGAQYTITPYWSLEGVGYYHKFENANSSDPAYSNQVVSLSLRNVIHFNQLLGTNRVWENVTPYALAGFGMVVREINDFGTNSFSPSALLGVGTGFKISDTMNFFLQYEYVATGNMDKSNRIASKSADHYGVFVAGLRFHLGAAGAAPRSWRKPAFELTETDYNTLMALNSRVDNIERQQSSQASDLSNLSGRVDGIDSRVSANERKISDLESKFAQLDAKVRDLEVEMAKKPEPTKDDGLTPILADGYYVQVYAANNLARAQSVRAHVRTLTDSPVLITQRHNIYEVRIGMYDRFPSAVNTLGAVSGSYSDAFVVKFPRPAHLSEDYKDIHTVN